MPTPRSARTPPPDPAGRAADRGDVHAAGPLRSALTAALDLLLPRNCPGCGAPEPWCPTCARSLDRLARRVPWPTIGEDPASTDRPGVGPPQVWALGAYTDPLRAAILAGKEQGRRDLPGRLGLGLGRSVAHLLRLHALPDPLWLVPAPSRRSSARRRGGDPVTRMAAAAAGTAATAVGRPVGVAPCLFTDRRAADSVGLDARARAVNLRNRVRYLAGAAPPAGSAVLIVDDVFTTGATVEVSARLLRARGHDVVGALVLAAAGAPDPDAPTRGELRSVRRAPFAGSTSWGTGVVGSPNPPPPEPAR